MIVYDRYGGERGGGMKKEIAELLKKQPSRCVDYCQNRGNVNWACQDCDKNYKNFKPLREVVKGAKK
jgi:hypothetical protein